MDSKEIARELEQLVDRLMLEAEKIREFQREVRLFRIMRDATLEYPCVNCGKLVQPACAQCVSDHNDAKCNRLNCKFDHTRWCL
jgi:hypothetical protein